ncbi:hypothetical protein BRC82_04290 [Halobacteriales archaeon QS_1_67_19]|nr:MAG: hypothetical protein BRC82_04290 [Halobacteriales archaeon QS_1_67_19]
MGASDHWYKNSVVYAVDVERFNDSNGDGVGDFPGLTRRLDYVSRLGIDCLWLLPFFPSPYRDNGYDVSVEDGGYEFSIDPYGYRWLRTGRADDARRGEWEKIE